MVGMYMAKMGKRLNRSLVGRLRRHNRRMVKSSITSICGNIFSGSTIAGLPCISLSVASTSGIRQMVTRVGPSTIVRYTT